MALKIPTKSLEDVVFQNRHLKTSFDNWIAHLLPAEHAHMGSAAYFYVPKLSSRVHKSFTSEACHYGLRNLADRRAEFLALGYRTPRLKKFQESSEAYRRWLLSAISPWRTLLTKDSYWVDRLLEDGTKSGAGAFVLGTNALKRNHRIIRNFAIALRMGAEKAHIIHVWHQLVQNKVDPAEALALCMYLSGDNEGRIYYQSYEASCDHWPVSARSLDWNRFARGKTNLTTEFSGLNNIWLNEVRYAPTISGQIRIGLTSDCPTSAEVKSNWFNTRGVAYYDAKEVAKWYLKNRKKYGIKSVRRRKVSTN